MKITNQETKKLWNNYQLEYQKNHYTQIAVKLNKDTAEKFKNKLKEDGIGQSAFIKNAIDLYLGLTPDINDLGIKDASSQDRTR